MTLQEKFEYLRTHAVVSLRSDIELIHLGRFTQAWGIEVKTKYNGNTLMATAPSMDEVVEHAFRYIEDEVAKGQ